MSHTFDPHNTIDNEYVRSNIATSTGYQATKRLCEIHYGTGITPSESQVSMTEIQAAIASSDITYWNGTAWAATTADIQSLLEVVYHSAEPHESTNQTHPAFVLQWSNRAFSQVADVSGPNATRLRALHVTTDGATITVTTAMKHLRDSTCHSSRTGFTSINIVDDYTFTMTFASSSNANAAATDIQSNGVGFVSKAKFVRLQFSQHGSSFQRTLLPGTKDLAAGQNSQLLISRAYTAGKCSQVARFTADHQGMTSLLNNGASTFEARSAGSFTLTWDLNGVSNIRIESGSTVVQAGTAVASLSISSPYTYVSSTGILTYSSAAIQGNHMLAVPIVYNDDTNQRLTPTNEAANDALIDADYQLHNLTRHDTKEYNIVNFRRGIVDDKLTVKLPTGSSTIVTVSYNGLHQATVNSSQELMFTLSGTCPLLQGDSITFNGSAYAIASVVRTEVAATTSNGNNTTADTLVDYTYTATASGHTPSSGNFTGTLTITINITNSTNDYTALTRMDKMAQSSSYLYLLPTTSKFGLCGDGTVILNQFGIAAYQSTGRVRLFNRSDASEHSTTRIAGDEGSPSGLEHIGGNDIYGTLFTLPTQVAHYTVDNATSNEVSTTANVMDKNNDQTDYTFTQSIPTVQRLGTGENRNGPNGPLPELYPDGSEFTSTLQYDFRGSPNGITYTSIRTDAIAGSGTSVTDKKYVFQLQLNARDFLPDYTGSAIAAPTDSSSKSATYTLNIDANAGDYVSLVNEQRTDSELTYIINDTTDYRDLFTFQIHSPFTSDPVSGTYNLGFYTGTRPDAFDVSASNNLSYDTTTKKYTLTGASGYNNGNTILITDGATLATTDIDMYPRGPHVVEVLVSTLTFQTLDRNGNAHALYGTAAQRVSYLKFSDLTMHTLAMTGPDASNTTTVGGNDFKWIRRHNSDGMVAFSIQSKSSTTVGKRDLIVTKGSGGNQVVLPIGGNYDIATGALTKYDEAHHYATAASVRNTVQFDLNTSGNDTYYIKVYRGNVNSAIVTSNFLGNVLKPSSGFTNNASISSTDSDFPIAASIDANAGESGALTFTFAAAPSTEGRRTYTLYTGTNLVVEYVDFPRFKFTDEARLTLTAVHGNTGSNNPIQRVQIQPETAATVAFRSVANVVTEYVNPSTQNYYMNVNSSGATTIVPHFIDVATSTGYADNFQMTFTLVSSASNTQAGAGLTDIPSGTSIASANITSYAIATLATTGHTIKTIGIHGNDAGTTANQPNYWIRASNSSMYGDTVLLAPPGDYNPGSNQTDVMSSLKGSDWQLYLISTTLGNRDCKINYVIYDMITLTTHADDTLSTTALTSLFTSAGTFSVEQTITFNITASPSLSILNPLDSNYINNTIYLPSLANEGSNNPNVTKVECLDSNGATISDSSLSFAIQETDSEGTALSSAVVGFNLVGISGAAHQKMISLPKTTSNGTYYLKITASGSNQIFTSAGIELQLTIVVGDPALQVNNRAGDTLQLNFTNNTFSMFIEISNVSENHTVQLRNGSSAWYPTVTGGPLSSSSGFSYAPITGILTFAANGGSDGTANNHAISNINQDLHFPWNSYDASGTKTSKTFTVTIPTSITSKPTKEWFATLPLTRIKTGYFEGTFVDQHWHSHQSFDMTTDGTGATRDYFDDTDGLISSITTVPVGGTILVPSRIQKQGTKWILSATSNISGYELTIKITPNQNKFTKASDYNDGNWDLIGDGATIQRYVFTRSYPSNLGMTATGPITTASTIRYSHGTLYSTNGSPIDIDDVNTYIGPCALSLTYMTIPALLNYNNNTTLVGTACDAIIQPTFTVQDDVLTLIDTSTDTSHAAGHLHTRRYALNIGTNYNSNNFKGGQIFSMSATTNAYHAPSTAISVTQDIAYKSEIIGYTAPTPRDLVGLGNNTMLFTINVAPQLKANSVVIKNGSTDLTTHFTIALTNESDGFTIVTCTSKSTTAAQPRGEYTLEATQADNTTAVAFDSTQPVLDFHRSKIDGMHEVGDVTQELSIQGQGGQVKITPSASGTTLSEYTDDRLWMVTTGNSATLTITLSSGAPTGYAISGLTANGTYLMVPVDDFDRQPKKGVLSFGGIYTVSSSGSSITPSASTMLIQNKNTSTVSGSYACPMYYWVYNAANNTLGGMTSILKKKIECPDIPADIRILGLKNSNTNGVLEDTPYVYLATETTTDPTKATVALLGQTSTITTTPGTSAVSHAVVMGFTSYVDHDDKHYLDMGPVAYNSTGAARMAMCANTTSANKIVRNVHYTSVTETVSSGSTQYLLAGESVAVDHAMYTTLTQ